MTILEKRKLIRSNTYANIHEAPYHHTNAIDRMSWSIEEKPCFDKEIFDFWKVYSLPFTDLDEVILDESAEIRERKKFIRYPITTATVESKLDPYVFGGVWIENVKPYKNGSKELVAHIHMKLTRDYRKFAYSVFGEFVDSYKNLFDYLYTAWGKRHPSDDPTNFLLNNNFKVQKIPTGGRAILRIKDFKQFS